MEITAKIDDQQLEWKQWHFQRNVFNGNWKAKKLLHYFFISPPISSWEEYFQEEFALWVYKNYSCVLSENAEFTYKACQWKEITTKNGDI